MDWSLAVDCESLIRSRQNNPSFEPFFAQRITRPAEIEPQEERDLGKKITDGDAALHCGTGVLARPIGENGRNWPNRKRGRRRPRHNELHPSEEKIQSFVFDLLEAEALVEAKGAIEFLDVDGQRLARRACFILQHPQQFSSDPGAPILGQ